ncbi:serine--tRNA ligase-like protein [Tanacetum coccineum]
MDEYAKHIRYLVTNKPKIAEGEDVKLNDRCLVVLQNQLPPKEKNLGSFIIPCSIGSLTIRNALADLGSSISMMPFSMFKRLGLRKLKQVSMIVEMADGTRSIPKGIVENLLVKIGKFIFPVDFVILDMVEGFRMPIILAGPLLVTTHAEINDFKKLISLEVKNERLVFKIEDNLDETLTPIESVCALRSIYSSEENQLLRIDDNIFLIDVPWEGMSFKDGLRLSHGKVCKMSKQRIWKDWWRKDLSGNSDYGDEENLIDEEFDIACTQKESYYVTNGEAYKERMCKLLGMSYKKPSPITIEKVEVTRYTVGPRESYTKLKVIEIEEMPRTISNVAMIRAKLMEDIDKRGSGLRTT